MTTRHLGKKIYALVDGRLSRDDAYVAMAHVGECEECAARWEALRKDRVALQTSGTGIDMSFATHLLDRDRIAEIAREEPRRHVKAAHGRGVNVLVVACSTLVGGVAVLGVLWTLGAPPVVDLVASAPDRASASSVQLMGAPVMRLEGSLVPWVHPDWDNSRIIPVDAALIQTSDGTNVLVATVLAGMDTVTVTEKRGHLPQGFGSASQTLSLNDKDVFVVGDGPSQVVWDAGGVVVGLGCTCSLDVLKAVASEFPDGTGDPGVFERLGDGLNAVADAVSGG